jgi:hypothetical protein
MYRISFERPCKKSITATDTILDREYTKVTLVNISEFRCDRRIFTEVIVWTDGHTNQSHKKF